MPNSLRLVQIVHELTRKDQILDLVLTDLNNAATTLARLETSDHNPVMVEPDVPVFQDKPLKRKVWRHDKADYWGMRGHLSFDNWTQALQTDPETACSNVTSIICEDMDLYIPTGFQKD